MNLCSDKDITFLWFLKISIHFKVANSNILTVFHFSKFLWLKKEQGMKFQKCYMGCTFLGRKTKQHLVNKCDLKFSKDFAWSSAASAQRKHSLHGTAVSKTQMLGQNLPFLVQFFCLLSLLSLSALCRAAVALKTMSF